MLSARITLFARLPNSNFHFAAPFSSRPKEAALLYHG
jgi:hypothetical protein